MIKVNDSNKRQKEVEWSLNCRSMCPAATRGWVTVAVCRPPCPGQGQHFIYNNWVFSFAVSQVASVARLAWTLPCRPHTTILTTNRDIYQTTSIVNETFFMFYHGPWTPMNKAPSSSFSSETIV